MHIRNNMDVLLLDTNIWQKIVIINFGIFLLEVAKFFVKKQMNRPVFVPLSASTTVDWEGQTRICYINGLKIEVFLMDLGWIVPQWLQSIVSLSACTFGIFDSNNALQFLGRTLIMSL